MGQTQSSPHHHHHPRPTPTTHRSFSSLQPPSLTTKPIQHQGILTLRPVPFKNCIEIQTQSATLFLQNIQITLKDLLNTRLYTNKLFPKQDVQRLIQNVTYTLAYLIENHIPYKDVSTQNIFYHDGPFKLLPNQLIPQSRFQRFLNSRNLKKYPTSTPTTQSYQQQSLSRDQQPQFITLSPQMIIAYRCKQTYINQLQILDKSNVFSLGLVLLETCTLLPSYECYDEETCDILDQVISQRLQLVRQYYSEQIASIVANMLDYDYSERMGLKEISIFINRELNKDLITNSKIVKELSNKKKPSKPQRCIEIPPSSDPTIDDSQSVVNHSQTKSVISKNGIEQTSEADSRITHPSHNVSVSDKKRSKTNKIYMNGGVKKEPQEEQVIVPAPKEQRNKIYMKQIPVQQQEQHEQKKSFGGENQIRTQGVLRQIPVKSNVVISTNDSRVQQTFEGKSPSFNNRQKYQQPITGFSHKQVNYQVHNQEDSQNYYPQNDGFKQSQQQQQSQMKRKNSTDYLGYRAPSHQASQQQRVQNQIDENSFSKNVESNRFESFDELNEECSSRGYFETRGVIKNGIKREYRQNEKIRDEKRREYGVEDNSLSRIKSQIQRSRRLIEDFKRGENVQFS